jgi:signal transduction histidine kinase
MNDLPRLIKRLKLPPLGLVLQLFAVILLPLTILLVAITFGSIFVHQRAMRTLVGDRDERAVYTAANALNAQLENRINELTSINLILSSNSYQPDPTIISNIGYLLHDFDAGVIEFNSQGKPIIMYGSDQEWNGWRANSTIWNNLFSQLNDQSGKINIHPGLEAGAYYGLISAKMSDGNLIVGAFYIEGLANRYLGNSLSPAGQLSTMLVGADHQVLYTFGTFTDQTANHPGVADALQGKTGTVYVKQSNGDEHVTAYSPVPVAGWALVTEESWESGVTPTLQTSQIAPLVLIPAVLIMLLALWLSASQVVRPLRKLESKASTLAWGDFKTIRQPVGGTAEIRRLQNQLIQMAHKVEDAQQSLHGYIGAITGAQEDERRRLARELHDDTLQALIALKQRVQLAQLEIESSTRKGVAEATELNEIASLIEKTIENLRRVTRALRPIYLEDLGLVPALEMLVRETNQSTGIKVEFQQLGVERRLEPASELALYRISQEALSNVARHARASKAELSLAYSPDMVTVIVADNGAGFEIPDNLSEFTLKGHFGLLSMHERAELIGANLKIISSPGRGTRLVITLPTSSTK